MEAVIENIKSGALLNREKDEKAAFVISEPILRKCINEIKSAFPANTKHRYAVKANALTCVLKIVKDEGLGIECASVEEVMVALNYGFPSEVVVYDSPCKTESEIKFCLEKGVYLNVDNLFELERIKKLRALFPESKTHVGLRINPQIKAGSIIETSTATATCKFGIPINEKGMKEKVLEAIKGCDYVVGLHVHVGSGGMSFKNLLDGASCICNLAEEINAAEEHKKIQYLDIGGGFPVEYNTDKPENQLTFVQYWEEVKKNIPKMLDYTLLTEYGRAIIARAGFLASRIEYVKEAGGRQISVMHVGADYLVWTAYSNEHMMKLYPIFLNENGEKIKKHENVENKKLDLVGPLCFSADNVCTNLDWIPELKADCSVILPIVGAYTLACWSKFNTRSVPAIYLLNKNNELKLMRAKESVEQNLSFWKTAEC